MQRKKAQGMSINVIIIAALALLVLVILSVILVGRMGFWTRNTNECTQQRGVCQDRQCDTGYTKTNAVCYGTDNKPDQYQVCCIEVSI